MFSHYYITGQQPFYILKLSHSRIMVSIFFKRSKNGYGYFWRSLSRQEEALLRRVIAEKNTRKCYKKCIFLLNRTDFNMAQQFVETIKIVNGKTQALAYH